MTGYFLINALYYCEVTPTTITDEKRVYNSYILIVPTQTLPHHRFS